ncbi:hypothetical protein SASPL_124925 [Salvia splendens]|uniref:5-formyltetrahydrofolate cyclo-ligase n=1 Tax=Salvia splendens TaxID=180675 RepID=A0A8X8XG69_SALSN|nr:hypothetical protein SASPL_124925 [Salvia splendens]
MIPQLVSPTAASPFLPILNLRSSTTMSAAAPLEALFKEKKALRSRAIQRVVLEAPWFKSCTRLCAYISCAALREVDTSKVLSEILKNTPQDDDSQARKKLYVPRVEDKNSFMRMLNITRMDDLVANSMDILEPEPCDAEGKEREDVMLADEPVDLFLLPGLAFDKSGRRIGRGGGYYDTFLTKYQELAKDLALSYSLQILEDGVIPITPNDVPIDALASSSGVIHISQAANEMRL